MNAKTAIVKDLHPHALTTLCYLVLDCGLTHGLGSTKAVQDLVRIGDGLPFYGSTRRLYLCGRIL